MTDEIFLKLLKQLNKSNCLIFTLLRKSTKVPVKLYYRHVNTIILWGKYTWYEFFQKAHQM